MSRIEVSDLTFYYDGCYENVFEHVSFSIDTDWKLGLVGRNGRGKTTLLKLLMGKYEYNGTISKNVMFDYFPFEISHKSKLTIDLVEEIYQEYELWKICRELSLLDMDAEVLYRNYESLSYGEQTKVLLALLFSEERKFLLIDEPTNHLDLESRELVRNYLNRKKGFILVSHDRWFLDGCIDHVLAINKSSIEVVQGDFSNWFYNKQRRDDWELGENVRLKKDIQRLSDSMLKKKEWSNQIEKSKIGSHSFDRGFIGAQSARMMKRAKSLEHRMEQNLEDKKLLLNDVEEVEKLKLFPLKHYKEKLVEVKQLSISYGKKTVCSNVNFDIANGERILLKGKNGCGKSSLLKCILGEEVKVNRELILASNLIISYVPQSAKNLTGSLNAYCNRYGIEESLFKTLLRKLDFERELFNRTMEYYSEGQKKKVLLARSLCEQAHLYIWDEPLNYIDIFSRLQIETLIQKFSPTILFVEHDKTFGENIATKVVEL